MECELYSSEWDIVRWEACYPLENIVFLNSFSELICETHTRVPSSISRLCVSSIHHSAEIIE